MVCLGCGVSVVEWDCGLCSPLFDVGLFKASIDGEGGVGRLLNLVCMDELFNRF